MKYLVMPEVQAADTMLSLINTGEAVIQGKLEAYSCKRVGADKKLSNMLDRQYSDPQSDSNPMPCGSLDRAYSGFTPILTSANSPNIPDDFTLSESPGVMARSASSSSVGVIPDANMRRLFINLLLTMNTMFPDYDFSSVRPEEFVEENNHDLVVHSINSSLQKAMMLEPTLAPQLWRAVETIKPQECFIFSYIPPAEGPLSESCIWSFNYFFYNKELKRVLFFTCSCTRPSTLPSESGDIDEMDYGSFDDETEQQMEFDMDM
eukprot:TRINITY_DN211_c0_g1_i1.p1 TRINITY_DN211_c0_g1~~TRINITY_DN211_c0_g1_i1.p1  ORF type:complete len:263 (+),score=32.58 TRINITY_DN211_c0_g1_i1:224-1012(+)